MMAEEESGGFWEYKAKIILVVLPAIAFAIFTIPLSDAESIGHALDTVAGLYPVVTPILLLSLFVCYKLGQSQWILPFWLLVAVPVLVLLCLVVAMLPQNYTEDGISVGKLAVRLLVTGYFFATTLPEVIPGVLLLRSCPSRANWRRIPLSVCVASVLLSLGFVQVGLRWATVPPLREAEATSFAVNFLKLDRASRWRVREGAFNALLEDSRAPASTLVKVASLLPLDSPYWSNLSRNPSLPEIIVNEHINEPRFAALLAQSPSAPPALLTRLSRSSETRVRTNVARNLSTPQETLKLLAQDRVYDVRYWAGQSLRGVPGTAVKQK
jgi:hypothetical protein